MVLRYGLLYGTNTWYSPAGARGVDARAGRLVADADISSFVKVDDAAAAAVDALHWPSGVAIVCDDEPAAGHEWLPAFCAAVGARRPPPQLDHGRRGLGARATGTCARTSAGRPATDPGGPASRQCPIRAARTLDGPRATNRITGAPD